MGCPKEVEIGDSLVFSVTTHSPSTNALTDADAVPTYRIYGDETGTPILTGSMAKLDDANTTGFYSEEIECTSGNGFENGKSYTIYITATVSSVTAGQSISFKAYDARKATDATGNALALASLQPDNKPIVDASGHTEAIKSNGAAFNDVSTTQVNAECDNALSGIGATSARMAYIDNLNVGGNVASQSDIQGITQAQRLRLLPPPQMERPDSGTTTFRVWVYSYNEKHEAEDLDNNPTITVENNEGIDRSSNLGSIQKPGGTTGQYYIDYSVSDAHSIEGLVFKCAATEGGTTVNYAAQSIVVDTTAVDFTASDRSKLESMFLKMPSKAYVAGTNNSDGDIQADEMTGNFVGSVNNVVQQVSANVTEVNSNPVSGVSDFKADVSDIATMLAKWSGITSLANWLRLALRKDFTDATAESEIGGDYEPATDSQEGIADKTIEVELTEEDIDLIVDGVSARVGDSVAGSILVNPDNKLLTNVDGYVYTIRIASWESVSGSTSSSTTGVYAGRGNIELIYGAVNVQKWADVDGDADTDTIANRISWALELAEAWVNDRLRMGPYEIPFTEVPILITDITARQAGILLYDARRITDEADDGDEIPAHRRLVENYVNQIVARQIRFSIDQNFTGYPKTI